MSTKIIWTNVIEQAREASRDFQRRVGTSPTLRGLFYVLVSKFQFPNTKGAYKGLSHWLTIARKNGSFSWRDIKDESRRTVGGDDNYELETVRHSCARQPLRRLEAILSPFENLIEPSLYYPLNKWEGQKKRILIAVEKDALCDAVEHLTNKWKVEVNAMRGYSSATNIKEIADKIRTITDNGFEVELILLTDFDPSGEDIARYVQDTLHNDFNVEVHVSKVAVTLEQIQKYGLPSTPESEEEKAKMARDSRFAKWEHGFFRVEVDALLAIVPEEFTKILEDEISQYFDEDIEEDMKEQRDAIVSETEEKLRELGKQFEDFYEEIKEKVEDMKKEMGE